MGGLSWQGACLQSNVTVSLSKQVISSQSQPLVILQLRWKSRASFLVVDAGFFLAGNKSDRICANKEVYIGFKHVVSPLFTLETTKRYTCVCACLFMCC